MLGRVPVSADEAAASPFDHPPIQGDQDCPAEPQTKATGAARLFEERGRGPAGCEGLPGARKIFLLAGHSKIGFH